MPVRMLYFAWVRERVGTGQEDVVPPPGVTTVAALVEWLAGMSEGHAEAFADRTRLRAVIDGGFVGMEAVLGDAREVAIFPPVTGG